ncbi:MAG: hypothetical protein HMLIMOIP_002087 [Candidatus Nitrosomirales archaeon]|jgi:hypothetical protein
MVLALVTPTGPNFIKDWPSQNEVNCDLIDAYAGPCLISQPLQTYVPVLSATITPPTLGAGNIIQGYYYRIFDQIFTWGHFRYGTGFNAGSGIYTITLPFKVKNLIALDTALANTPIVGNGHVWDESNALAGGRQPVTCQLRTNQILMFGIRMNSGAAAREVSNTIPITWAVDDGLKWFARYQRDPT